MSVTVLHSTDDLLEKPASFRFVHLSKMTEVNTRYLQLGVIETYLSLLDNVIE